MIIFYCILVVLVALMLIVLIRTIQSGKKQDQTFNEVTYAVDKQSLIDKVSKAITYQTITCSNNENLDKQTFLAFHGFLEDSFPNLHRVLKKEIVNEYSLLYKWQAKQQKQRPCVLMAHMDVVPISEKTLSEWKHEPFSGHIDDEYIWGRGTLDMKGHLITLCEAVEYCIVNGIEPKRDIYLAFGHDEESVGQNGMKKIVEIFKQRDIRPEFVLDEGGAVINGKSVSVDGLLGLVGIAEKGYADITIQVSDKGGHASQPPSMTAVAKLAKALMLLQKNQLKATLNQPMRDFLGYSKKYMSFPLRMLASNLWLFGGVLKFAFSKNILSRALIQTTFAPTMLSASNASNVLAQQASATINFRISPDDSVEKLVNHIEKVIAKTGAEVVNVSAHDPSSISDVNSNSFKAIKKSINETMQGVNVSPYLVIATTDSRMFSDIADNVYRFSPFRSISEDLGTIHANNERIKKQSVIEGVDFFIRLIENSDY